MNTNLKSLRERVRRATAPNRELDAQIVVAFDLRPEWCNDGQGKLWIDHKSGLIDPVIRLNQIGRKNSTGNPPIGDYPRYSASIDAAVALIDKLLPGHSWEVRRSGFGHMAMAAIWNPSEQPSPHNTWPSNGQGEPALALCDALLTALIAAEPA